MSITTVLMRRVLGAWVLVAVAMATAVPASAASERDEVTFEGAVANGIPSTASGLVPQVLNLAAGSLCSGTFITDEWVLTAAHCLGSIGGPSAEPDALIVQLDSNGDGSLDIPAVAGDGLAFGVQATVVHPSADAALVRLAQAAPLLAIPAPIVDLATEPDVVDGFEFLVGYGWGDDRVADLDNSTLHAGQFASLDRTTCSTVISTLSPSELCYDDPRADVDLGDRFEVCSGDSGGPLFALIDQQVAQVGIITAVVKPRGTRSCDGTLAIGIGERVGALSSWIQDNVADVGVFEPITTEPTDPFPPDPDEPDPDTPDIGEPDPDAPDESDSPEPDPIEQDPEAVDPEPVTPTDPELGADSATITGYWMLGADGTVYAFGAAGTVVDNFSQVPAAPPLTDLVADPQGRGAWALAADGTVYPLGGAPDLGSATGLAAGERAVGLAPTDDGGGYWVATDRGRIVAVGAAPDFDDVLGLALNSPIIDIAVTVDGAGAYLLGADGGVFALGRAPFLGSTGGQQLNAPVVGMAVDPDGQGYWLVAADGGVFSYGADFYGSMGGEPLNSAMVGMVASGSGYLMVAADGGVFAFGTLPFFGSLGATTLNTTIIAIAPTG